MKNAPKSPKNDGSRRVALGSGRHFLVASGGGSGGNRGGAMHPLVRDLYKRLMWTGRTYPAGLAHVRERAKREFFANRAVTDPKELRLAVARGRWMVKEMIGVAQLQKYRTMRKRY